MNMQKGRHRHRMRRGRTEKLHLDLAAAGNLEPLPFDRHVLAGEAFERRDEIVHARAELGEPGLVERQVGHHLECHHQFGI